MRMSGNLLAVAAALGSVALCWVPVSRAASITTSDIRGSGAWQTEGKLHRAAQQWSLDVAREPDNSIRGRISVNDSPLLSAGNVEGQIVGNRVSGKVSDDDGRHLLTFDGKVTSDGMFGTYTDRTGEVGTWAWDGLPLK